MSEYFDLWKLLAGLGLFLFGMRYLETALKQLAGKGFRHFLRQSTDKPISSVFGGLIATTIVQSSSLVGLIVLAFVGAGIIPLVNAIGIVLGSNLGTTFTGWIVATLGFKLDLTLLIYPLLGIGGLSYGLLKGHWKSFSQLALSFALLLMGLEFMKDSVSTLTEHFDIKLISGYPLIVFLLVGVFFTAIIQSSSATMMLTLSALYADIIPLPAAAALVIGADLGTTSTVLLGSMQGAVSKRRLAMAHVLFNLSVDTLAFIALLPLLALISKLHIDDPLFALVAFHSLFNLLGILIFLPFIKKFTTLLERWIKEKQQHTDLYLHNVPVDVTDAALEALTQETQHLLYRVLQLNLRFLHINPDVSSIKSNSFTLPRILASSKLDQYIVIKKLEGEIINYAYKIQRTDDGNHPQDNSEEVARSIDRLIKSIRSGVYSAKSLKDINDDLEAFNLQDNDILTGYFNKLKDWGESIYPTLLRLLVKLNENEKTIIEEELATLRQKSKIFHHEFEHSLYKRMSGIHLSSLDLSTLLNVNKEMQTSEKMFMEAIG